MCAREEREKEREAHTHTPTFSSNFFRSLRNEVFAITFNPSGVDLVMAERGILGMFFAEKKNFSFFKKRETKVLDRERKKLKQKLLKEVSRKSLGVEKLVSYH